MMPKKSNLIGLVPVMALTLAGLIPLQSAATSNCLWAGGSGNFHNKNKWANCRPGKKDNAEIGVSWIDPPTGNVDISYSEEMHNLYLNSGSVINLYYAMAVYGNDFYNGGTLNLLTGSVQPYFRSYSKNLQIYGAGAIYMFGGKLSGNITFGSGQLVHGSGIIGEESDLLFNNGAMQADRAGDEILFARSIDGTGTFRSQNGGRLHFTGESSGDYLINNGLVQLDGVNFVVARDYQGSFFYSGNDFDARRTVQGTGQILAADAHQVVSGPKLAGNVIAFGAMRVGGKATTTLTVTNTGGLTTLRGAVQNKGAPNVLVTGADFALGAGASRTASLTFSGISSGSFFGQTIDVVNNFSNVADDYLLVSANVYAPAVPHLASTTVDFGVVRKGTIGVTGHATIGNFATGPLSDVLLTSFSATPGNISLTSSPTYVLAGTASNAVYGLDTSAAGFVGGFTRIGFTSHDSELADLSLGSQTLGFTGTVTDPAVALLFMQGGAGIFSGGGGLYSLDLGRLAGRSGSVSTDIGVLNAVFGWGFAESLIGAFTLTGDPGFTFTGDGFGALAGGERDIGNWLRFDTVHLAAGSYQSVLTFSGFSRYAGLNDLTLAPIRLTISATIASVPEPSSWAMMIAGFGVIGMTARRRARKIDLAAAIAPPPASACERQ